MVASWIMKRGLVGLKMIHIKKIIRSIMNMKATTPANMRRRSWPRSSSLWWPHSFTDMMIRLLNNCKDELWLVCIWKGQIMRRVLCVLLFFL